MNHYNVSSTYPVYYHSPVQTGELKFFREVIQNLGINENMINEKISLVCPDLAKKSSYFLKSSPKLDTQDVPPEAQSVADFYRSIIMRFTWNNKDFINYPVLPALYICEEKEVDQIASTGFTNVPTRRDYFGEGYYFTTSPKRIIPLLKEYEEPVVIICFTFPGNPYYITKPPDMTNNLLGSRIMPGYNSHYVLLNERGHPIEKLSELDCPSSSSAINFSSKSKTDKQPLLKSSDSSVSLSFFSLISYQDELILPEKSEILPIFLLKMKSNLINN